VELHRQQHRLDGYSLIGTVITDTPSGGGEVMQWPMCWLASRWATMGW
jgi:hypothetical protein